MAKLKKPKPVIPFYTHERWQNWLIKAKESGFKPDDQENGAIFVYMEDDIVLACLKVIAKYDRNLISEDEALKYIAEIKDIVLKQIESIDEDIDIMLESTQVSLVAIFASCESYINGEYVKTKTFTKLLKEALKAEKDDNMAIALDRVAQIGANILAGLKFKEKDFENIPEGIIAEWIDGIDCIGAAMMGDTSYRDDEPDNEN
jgi:hypothetical protein